MNMSVKSMAVFQQMYPSFINFCQRSRRPTGPLNRAPLCTTGDFAKKNVTDLKYNTIHQLLHPFSSELCTIFGGELDPDTFAFVGAVLSSR